MVDIVARVAPLLLLAALPPGAGCSGAPRIEIASGEARLSPALAGVASVFLTIANPGDRSDRLVGVAVDLPGAVAQIHEFRDGRMVQGAGLAVPAHGSLSLRPGGPHIMVFQLPRETGAGSRLTLRLVFETSGEKTASLTIRGLEKQEEQVHADRESRQ